MTTPRPPAIPTRSLMRFGLAGMAVEMFLIGVPASVAPEWFYGWFPFGRGWAGALGAYNEHYVLDLGYVYLALGVVTAWATIQLGRDLCRAVLIASIVANAPHVIFHLFHTHALPAGDNIAQDSLLGITVVIGLALLVLTWTRPESTELPTADVLHRSVPTQPAQAESAKAEPEQGEPERATAGVAGER